MVMVSVAEAIVSVKFADLLALLESVTVNVRGVAFTATVGVPVMAPLVAFSVRPAGSVPELSAQL